MSCRHPKAETPEKSLKRRIFPLSLALFFWIAAISGCAGRTTTQPILSPNGNPPNANAPGAQVPPVPGNPEVFGPPLPPDLKKPSPEKAKVGLVLGGAGVASFATVGLLKRFQEEGIQVEYIIASGWPALFAVGYGLLRSVHDLEWFAMRLQQKDFYSASLFEANGGYASHDRLSNLIENSFSPKDLAETRIPVVIAAANTEPADPEIFDKGDWKAPLLKTMSVPGIYQPYPEEAGAQGTSSLQGLNVEEAVKRGARTIVAVSMYDDYFNSLKGTKNSSSDAVFRRLYLTQMKNSIAKEFKLAQLTGKIILGKPADDFTAKRLAILSGYKEGARLARELRNQTVN